MTYTPSHVGICVSDLDRSLRFYRDGLGFELSDRFEIDDATAVVSQMIVNGPMKVELLHYPGRTSRGTPSTSRGLRGLTHLSFIVEDVDEAAARLVEHGGTILPDTRVNVGVDIVFLTDPDGTRIELMTT